MGVRVWEGGVGGEAPQNACGPGCALYTRVRTTAAARRSPLPVVVVSGPPLRSCQDDAAAGGAGCGRAVVAGGRGGRDCRPNLRRRECASFVCVTSYSRGRPPRRGGHQLHTRVGIDDCAGLGPPHAGRLRAGGTSTGVHHCIGMEDVMELALDKEFVPGRVAN